MGWAEGALEESWGFGMLIPPLGGKLPGETLKPPPGGKPIPLATG